jgi:hypothetical protein
MAIESCDYNKMCRYRRDSQRFLFMPFIVKIATIFLGIIVAGLF